MQDIKELNYIAVLGNRRNRKDEKMHCKLCGTIITDENKSSEHIIHNAIGGILENLLCFCRLNLETCFNGRALVDVRYQNHFRRNCLLNPKNLYILQNPSDSMLNFGDAVVLIKDVESLTERILCAVNREGGLCVIGDVRYHEMIDRTEPYTGFKHSASLRCEMAYVPISSVTSSVDAQDVIHYGAMDKYTRFEDQHEWRVCWLPDKRDLEPRILQVGNLSDLATVIATKNLRDTLLEMYPGYYLGETHWVPREIIGNTTYDNFTNTIENIDGMCRPILEIG
ncbi:MAG: hypothetical protein IKZ43_08360 [Acidaminococcaceae bacterium]|nr:hypothetical protein [Acidaminococcaceae bacterium]